jgi:TrmH family RNA methyltransferase
MTLGFSDQEFRQMTTARMQNLRVVLVATRNPLNMGAVARAMSNFGAEHLRVVHPYEKAFREAVSAVGAAAVLREAKECASVKDAVADCGLVVGTTAIGNREIKHPLRSLDKAGAVIRRRLVREQVAILFGSEKKGLSNDDLSYCHWILHIPTREEHASMNLGQAAAVCLWEIARGERSIEEGVQRPLAAQGKGKAANMEIVERITAAMLDCLVKSGYVAARSEGLAEEKLRRMIRRFSLDEGDAEVFLGMVRKMRQEIEKSEGVRRKGIDAEYG